MATAIEKITAVKRKILQNLDLAWFGPLIGYLAVREDEGVGTAAVRGDGTLLVNPKFVDGLDKDAAIFLVLHEVMHLAYQHHETGKGRIHRLFNIAGDLRINDDLVALGLKPSNLGGLIPDSNHRFEFPACNTDGCRRREFTVDTSPDRQTSHIYSDILRKLCEHRVQGEDGDIHGDGESPDGEAEESGSDNKVARAARGNRMGKVPGGFEREIQAMRTFRTNWKGILKAKLNKSSKRLTWRRPNKRYAETCYLQGSERNTSLRVVAAVDTSGSISNEELSGYLGELANIVSTFPGTECTIISCDSDIHDVTSLKSAKAEEVLRYKAKGGGGTDFNPVFDHVNENMGGKVDALIYFTDMYGSFPNSPPRYSVFWATKTDGHDAPFGRMCGIE